MLVVGVVIGSLPYTLSIGKTVAQINPPKPGAVPARIDQIVIGNDYNLYLTSGTRIYKIHSTRLVEGQWWTMPGYPSK